MLLISIKKFYHKHILNLLYILLFQLVRKEKGPFTEVEEHMTPKFVVQVLDSDAASQDDFLGRYHRPVSFAYRSSYYTIVKLRHNAKYQSQRSLSTSLITSVIRQITLTEQNSHMTFVI